MIHRLIDTVLASLVFAGSLQAATSPTGTPPPKSAVIASLGLEDGRMITVPAPILDADGRTARVLLPLGDGVLGLKLRQHSVRAEGFQLLADTGTNGLEAREAPPVETYRGFAEGHPGSLVAISIHPDGIAGRIQFGDGRELWIEPATGDPAGPRPRRHLVYQTIDIRPTDAHCGVPDQPGDPAPRVHPVGPPPNTDQLRMGGLCKAQIVIDCDFPFFQRMGEDIVALARRVDLVLNTMNLQYNTEVGIDHRLTAIVVRTSSGVDPYVGAILCDVPGTAGLEDQVATIWDPANLPLIERDIAHLFTGRVSGGVIGCNFTGVVCDEDAYGVSAIDYNGNLASSTDLLAHELGHGWGASHCPCNSPPYTMNASITGVNQFRPDITIPRITNYRDANDDCLDCGGASTVGCGEGPQSCYAGSTTLSTHCRDEACCILVCAIDPFCCSSSWDTECAVQAVSNCAGCGDPAAGSPFEANGTPGCLDVACCEIMCGLDPFCCEYAWDQTCADDAIFECGECGDPDAGSAYQPHPGIGSSDTSCCALACVEDFFCCTQAWDQNCVNFALTICAGCGEDDAGSPFLANGTQGCDDLECCGLVCSADAFCCETAWDAQCAARAAISCDGWCLGDLNFDGTVQGDDLGLLVAEWGSTSAPLADFDGNGTVDGSDFGLFLGNWGTCGY